MSRFERQSDRRLSSLAEARYGIGLGAGMALRREAILSLGGSDETLGPGSRFGSGDDWDLSVRTLLAHWHVYRTAHVSILHHGFRTSPKDGSMRSAIGLLSGRSVPNPFVLVTSVRSCSRSGCFLSKRSGRRSATCCD